MKHLCKKKTKKPKNELNKTKERSRTKFVFNNCIFAKQKGHNSNDKNNNV